MGSTQISDQEVQLVRYLCHTGTPARLLQVTDTRSSSRSASSAIPAGRSPASIVYNNSSCCLAFSAFCRNLVGFQGLRVTQPSKVLGWALQCPCLQLCPRKSSAPEHSSILLHPHVQCQPMVVCYPVVYTTERSCQQPQTWPAAPSVTDGLNNTLRHLRQALLAKGSCYLSSA
jgi:hypothetical protein